MLECAVTVARQLLVAAAAAALVSPLLAAGGHIGMPNCTTSCGGVSVPYPFGLGTGCHLPGFNLTCDTSHAPPRLIIGNGTLQVTGIFLDNSTLRVQGPVVMSMVNYGPMGSGYQTWTWGGPGWGLDGNPYVLSSAFNEFVLIGCSFFGELLFAGSGATFTINSCGSVCDTLPTAPVPTVHKNHQCLSQNSSSYCKKCFGIGCCQVPVPVGRASYDVRVRRLLGGIGVVPYDLFISEEGWFDRNVTSMELTPDERNAVPVVLAWAIWSGTLPRLKETRQGNATCPEDLGKPAACHSSYSTCTNVGVDALYTEHESGYTCKCWEGYQGNPYLPDGCQDIDECALSDICYGNCTNKSGAYLCECPRGTHGNPYIPHGCVELYVSNPQDASHPGLNIIVGLGVGSGAALLFLILGIVFLLRKLKNRRAKRLRQRFFKRNRGQLLQHLVCQRADIAERMIITLKELKKATNNFDKVREVGGGGHGTVYKGILSSLHVVAIKKSKILVQREINDFINEVAILSQINHKNIVKLLGCCLETEVPLLVYEFITNGTLYDHLHVEALVSLSWKDRLRIAVETARALSYLHSFVSMPIIHRDIKSPNILLDDHLTVKLSDFGASRYVPIDQTGVDTVVQGTFGYLDPTYYTTGHLTEKSDVYSFGVILIELLTRKKPVSYRSTQGYGLVKHFVTLLSEHNLDHILDRQVTREGDGEVVDVALLAAMCVKFASEERPTMRQVEMTLESIHAAKEYTSSDVADDESDDTEDYTWKNDLSVGGTVAEAMRIAVQNEPSP